MHLPNFHSAQNAAWRLLAVVKAVFQTTKDIPPVDAYTVGWICALREEYDASCRMLDEEFENPGTEQLRDPNAYVFGRIGEHLVALTLLRTGSFKSYIAAQTARDMARSFPHLRFILSVGVGDGNPSPEHDVQVGDIVVGVPTNTARGIEQYDMRKHLRGGRFELTGRLNPPPDVLLSAVSKVQGQYNGPMKSDITTEHLKRMNDLPGFQRPEYDRVYHSDHRHGGQSKGSETRDRLDRRGSNCTTRGVMAHYGTIASGCEIADVVTKAVYADDPKMNILCYDTVAAGLMNSFPSFIIRGIGDYCNSCQDDRWRSYAASTAASYARELLLTVRAEGAVNEPRQESLVHLPGTV
ncbi:uncharacterized protein BO80DRAFT_83472 [Aspergillus ibericus CBS 121593]|uniref:Purine and uridine phosphorylase n=1 Tax=Aspergillus ibericus CBS 121593 TaxID=1448316 RepID=A0A395HDG7_9EURO|nr:hypothetical protein BO80DRAFT_83472 [Aspergillus ibericus CBS 121593]RAL05882.1 hypothetical protein BO80DRAFT_83472 [Aspergillus ibericus CBS 121593]